MLFDTMYHVSSAYGRLFPALSISAATHKWMNIELVKRLWCVSSRSATD